MITVRFYVGSKYMGWEKFKASSELGYRNWIISGNTLRIGGAVVANLTALNKQLETI